MSACTDNILPIQPDECIGSSLVKINNNFNTLQTTTQELVNRFDSTKNIRTFFYYGPNTETNIINGAYNYGAPFGTSARVYPVSHPAWSTFMNNHAVWTNPGTNALINIPQNTYRKLTITQDGLYTIECQADNDVYVYVDGVLAAFSDNFTSNITRKFVTLKAGLHTLYFRAVNYSGNPTWGSNPAGWACRITDSSSKVIWDTRTYAEEEVNYLPVGPTTKTVTADNTTSRPSSLTIESFVNSNRELNLPSISRPGDIAYVIYQKTGFSSTLGENFSLAGTNNLLPTGTTTTPETPRRGTRVPLSFDTTYNSRDYWDVQAGADGSANKFVTLNLSINGKSYSTTAPGGFLGDDTYIGFDENRIYSGSAWPTPLILNTIGPAPGNTGTFRFSFGSQFRGYSSSITGFTKIWNRETTSVVSNRTTIDIDNSFAPAFIVWKLTHNGTEYFVDSGFPKFTQSLTNNTANWNNPLAWNSY